MPELPEVETIVRDLSANLSGSKIKDFQLFNEKTINISLRHWRQRVVGQKIIKVWRRGKQIIFDLSSGEHVVIHLKMTGQLIWRNKKKTIVGGHSIIGVGKTLPNKFSRAIFKFTNGGQLFFNDIRKFGWLRLLMDKELSEKLSSLGVEPLSRVFTAAKLQEILKTKPQTKIKAGLLDQVKVAGIGNIYADESLWLSRIAPDRRVADLKPRDWQNLTSAIKQVLRLSIKHRGTSFSDYRDAQGVKGNFISKLKVYGRAGQACLNCGQAIKKTRLAGRGTHFCERCQK